MAKPLKVAGIFFAGLMLWMLVMILLPSGEDKTPTIYHHPDGTFSLNRKDGKSVTSSESFISHLHSHNTGKTSPASRLAV